MTITKNNFNEVLEKSTEMPVLIDFWASWCGPCRAIAPVIEQLQSEAEGKAVVGKVNVDEETELSEKFSVYSIPTIIVLKDKKVAAKSVGYKSLDELKQLLGI